MGIGRTVVRYLFLGAISALLVALGARLLDEILGLSRHEGDAIYKNIEPTDESDGLDAAEQIELERTVLPGISIRS
jgi:hypothetical protein